MNFNAIGNHKADILVVDDTPDNIRFLSTLLLEQGYFVRKALSGQMALTAIQTLPPDLILLDVNMPGMNGYEVCEQLKSNEHTSSIPIIFLSALDSAADKVRAFQSGGVDYITKPFQFDEVLVRIQTQLTIQALQTQLQTQNQQLRQALDDLKKAQSQLVQHEKMSGLGQLVAGFSHEINNPLSFIAGNLIPARAYIHDLLKLIQVYQQEYPDPTLRIQEVIDQVDLEFLISDLHNLLSSMETGAKRIRAIILSLRIFSRLDESDIKPVNIHIGIDSTLMLLQQRLRSRGKFPEIKVIKNYGNIPLITCYASQLNQVFLNLLNNAIDSLTLRHSKADPNQETADHQSPIIWISTQAISSETVEIRIKDNGLGVAEADQSHIFEPFYTTKSIGEGSGLGLSISYEIVVEKHRGQISCQSLPGQGAEFIVEIPMNLKKN
jgi:signal transduction histidine kinase